jgi:FkbM family methyltransferase
MLRFLFQCIKYFGIEGILVYLKIKLNATSRITIPGIKFPIVMRPGRADRTTFREIFIKREYDVDLPAAINPCVIVDAGANIGFTSVFFANRYTTARIFSIEPDEDNFRTMLKNVTLYPTITPIQSALWSKKEMIKVVDHGYGDRGFIVEKSSGDNSLLAISLNNLISQFQIESIDILKMDIEGSEKHVFSENYDKWLSVTKCLIIELHDRMNKGCSKAVFSALSNYDFSMSIKGENLVFINNRFLP